MKAIYKFEADFGRYGVLRGLFLADKSEVKYLIGKELYFYEVLGKHSEIRFECKEDHITRLETSFTYTDWFETTFGDSFGIDPRNFVCD